jgi:hypothetical protein
LDKQAFELPISEEDFKQALEALLAGYSISISGCFVGPDLKSDDVWGTDLYGVDSFYASPIDETALRRAIEWANFENTRSSHPAEFCW